MLEFDITRSLPKHSTRHLLHFRSSLRASEDRALFIALCASNGGGKSSLLNMLSGIDRPDSGVITFAATKLFDTTTNPNINLAPEARRVGYVFQEQRLFPHIKVEGNLRYAARARKRNGKISFNDGNSCKYDSKQDFAEVVESLALAGLLNRYPARLSGGEKQRVALARALLSSPRLLLLDEPLSSVDRQRKQRALRLLEAWNKQRSITIIYANHDLEECATLASHAITIVREESHSAEENIDAKGENIARSRVSAYGSIEEITTRLETSSEIGARALSIVPAYLGHASKIDSLWEASLNDPAASSDRASFELSTPDGMTPPLICNKKRTAYVRIRADDVLLAESDDKRACTARVLEIRKNDNDSSHTGQLLCGGQRLLISLTEQQTRYLDTQKDGLVSVRIRKAESGIR